MESAPGVDKLDPVLWRFFDVLAGIFLSPSSSSSDEEEEVSDFDGVPPLPLMSNSYKIHK